MCLEVSKHTIKFQSVNYSGAGLQEEHRVHNDGGIHSAQPMEEESQEAKGKVRTGCGDQPGYSQFSHWPALDLQTQAPAISVPTVLYLFMQCRQY
jgi:hypothetical protein